MIGGGQVQRGLVLDEFRHPGRVFVSTSTTSRFSARMSMRLLLGWFPRADSALDGSARPWSRGIEPRATWSIPLE